LVFNGIPDFHSASGQSDKSDDFEGYASESDGKLPESDGHPVNPIRRRR